MEKKESQISLTPAYYQSIPVLVEVLNKAIKKKGLKTVNFTADPTTMRVSVDCGTATVTGSFLEIFGWKRGTVVKGTEQSPGISDITRGVQSVFVYIDCIKATSAGSFSVNLIKEGPIGTHRPGDFIQWRAHMPVEVHKLSTQTLSQIEVTIKDIHNKVIDFNDFNVSLLLAIEHRLS